MPQIQAWQHIYANVEAELSPQGRGGYQTLFYSRRGLTEDEVAQIERRLLYYAGDEQPTKRVFHLLESGKVMAGQVVSVAGADKEGRTGRYMAHTLVFDPGPFRLVACDVLGLLDRFPFMTTVEAAVRQGDSATGDISLATVEVPSGRQARQPDAASGWAVDQLHRLSLLALRARRLAEERRMIAVVGTSEDIRRVLDVALVAVPSDLLPYCSFDTWFYRCNPVAIYAWLVGLPESLHNPRFFEVDPRSKRVDGDLDALPRTAYERWLLEKMRPDNLPLVLQQKDAAFALCSWLEADADRVPSPDTVQPELVQSVFGVNAELVRQKVWAELLRHLPERLARRLLEPVFSRATPAGMFEQLRQGFNPHLLLDQLHALYAAEGYRPPEAVEREVLGETLAGVDHAPLRLLHSYWGGHVDRLQQEIDQLDETRYRQFVQMALRQRLGSPFAFLTRRHAHTFVQLYLASGPPDQPDLSRLIAVLTDLNEPRLLAVLVPTLDRIPPDHLRAVAATVEALQDRVPEDFYRAVIEAVAKLPSPPGVLARLRKTLTRLFGSTLDDD